MTKKEIFELEIQNTDRIYLFLEGMFWIAYERSAFRFVHSVKPYQVKKKFIKNIGCELVSLGFPATALDAVAAGLKRIDVSDKQIVFKVSESV